MILIGGQKKQLDRFSSFGGDTGNRHIYIYNPHLVAQKPPSSPKYWSNQKNKIHMHTSRMILIGGQRNSLIGSVVSEEIPVIDIYIYTIHIARKNPPMEKTKKTRKSKKR